MVMIGTIAFIAKAVAAVIIAVLFAGCVPIPIVRSTQLPSVSAHVPEDLLAGDATVMILVQVDLTENVVSHAGLGELRGRPKHTNLIKALHNS